MACRRSRRKRKTEVERLQLEEVSPKPPTSQRERNLDAYLRRLNKVEHLWTFDQMTQVAIKESLETQAKVGHDSPGKPEQRKTETVTPADHQTTTTDQTVISEEEFARPDLSSDGPLVVPSLEETPDSTTSDKAVPDSVPAAAAAKTSGKSETTLKPVSVEMFI